jgi:hypothetical protein
VVVVIVGECLTHKGKLRFDVGKLLWSSNAQGTSDGRRRIRVTQRKESSQMKQRWEKGTWFRETNQTKKTQKKKEDKKSFARVWGVPEAYMTCVFFFPSSSFADQCMIAAAWNRDGGSAMQATPYSYPNPACERVATGSCKKHASSPTLADGEGLATRVLGRLLVVDGVWSRRYLRAGVGMESRANPAAGDGDDGCQWYV